MFRWDHKYSIEVNASIKDIWVFFTSPLPSRGVVATLGNIELERGLPEVITVDNKPEYTSKTLQNWAKKKRSPP